MGPVVDMKVPHPAGDRIRDSAVGSDAWAAARLQAIAQCADREAFAALFVWYAPRIKGFLMRGGCDADTAQELAQDAMIAVWNRAATFDGGIARPSTWIFAIARNRRIDRLRRERRFELALEDLRPLLGDESGPATDAVAAFEARDRVGISVDVLQPDQLQVIRKAFWEDKSHSQIASELGLPLGTVKSRIRHALLRLRTAMQKEGR